MQTFPLLAVLMAVGAAPVPVTIVPRATWDPSPRTNGVRYPNPRKLADVYRTIVVHHSDFTDAPGPLVIKSYHLEVSHFADIGYHFVIATDGTVYEARSLERMGAHAGATREATRGRGHSKDPDWGSIGIVLDGFFHEQLPPPAQRAALALLVNDLRKRFPNIDRVLGHREVRAGVLARGLTPLGEPTVCPGDRLFRWLDEGGLEARPAAVATVE